MNPLLRALQVLGGSGSIEEIYDKVVELEQFSEEVISHLHDPEKSNQSEVAYRLAWARTYLKKFGILENSARGIWSLNQNTKEAHKVDPHKVVQFVRTLDKKEKETGAIEAAPLVAATSEVSEEPEWKAPAAFERLVQRLLRESGFKQVEVTACFKKVISRLAFSATRPLSATAYQSSWATIDEVEGKDPRPVDWR
jgi:restriction system protein